MSDVMINKAQNLYVISAGRGYSCLGFEYVHKRTRAVLAWIGEAAEADNLPPIGTVEHFQAYQAARGKGNAHAAATGQRCPVELCPELEGLEGCRVEATIYGERRRFKVGKSTGWLPCHLALHNERSIGGVAIARGSISGVVVIRRKGAR